MFHALLTLIRKEFQAIFSTPTNIRMLIMPVLLQLFLFPFAATLEVKNSTLAIDNLDGGAASIELVQRLAATQAARPAHPCRFFTAHRTRRSGASTGPH